MNKMNLVNLMNLENIVNLTNLNLLNVVHLPNLVNLGSLVMQDVMSQWKYPAIYYAIYYARLLSLDNFLIRLDVTCKQKHNWVLCVHV